MYVVRCVKHIFLRHIVFQVRGGACVCGQVCQTRLPQAHSLSGEGRGLCMWSGVSFWENGQGLYLRY